MTDIAAMLNAYPAPLKDMDQDLYVICVQECLNCAQTCTACADACLVDPDRAKLAECAGAALICADIVGATVRTLARRAGHDRTVTRVILRACIEACRAGYDECRRKALQHEHCRVCADACLRCAHACRQLLTSLVDQR